MSHPPVIIDVTNREESLTINACGIREHDVTCLCDVKLPADPVKVDGEQWAGSTYTIMALRAFGESIREDSNRMLGLLETLAKAKDVVDAKLNPPVDVDTLDERRAKLLTWIRGGDSIVDAPIEFGWSWDDTLRALTRNTPSALWAWTEEEWADAECFIADNRPVGERAIMRSLDITASSARALVAYYDCGFARIGRSR